MAALKPEDVIRRANSADQEKQNWVSQYQDAFEFALPMRNLYSTFQPGADKMTRVFNSTQIISTQKFASRLQSNLTPPNQMWLDFLPGTEIPKEDHEKSIALLQDVQKRFFALIDNSNFNTVINEYYLDLAVGTAAMTMMEGDDENPFIFTAVPNAEISMDEGPMGAVDGIFRQTSIAARNIEPTWADLTPAGKEKIAQLIKESNLASEGKLQTDAKINILESTYFDHKEKVFWYQVILKGTQDNSQISQPTQMQNLDTGGATLLVERRLKDNPWIVTRWVKVSGEVFGRGPLLFALPDIKSLNKAEELMLQNASMQISGLWAVTSDSIANLDMVNLAAGTFLPMDNIEDIKRLDAPGDFNVASVLIERLENSVRAALFDRDLPDPSGAVRSPTEIIERVNQLAQDIGAPFSRIEAELLKPMAQRGLNIMFRRGLLPDEITDGLNLNGRKVKLIPTSPLARQQNLNDLKSAIEWLQMVQTLGPQVLMGTVKVEDFAQWSAEKLAIDQFLVRDPAERKKVQEQIAQLIVASTEQPVG